MHMAAVSAHWTGIAVPMTVNILATELADFWRVEAHFMYPFRVSPGASGPLTTATDTSRSPQASFQRSILLSDAAAAKTHRASAVGDCLL